MSDTIITLAYELRFDNAEGDLLERYTEADPDEMLLGRGQVLEVLEKALDGLKAGDTFEMVIEPAQGYGDYDEEKLVTVSEAELMAGVPEDERTELEEGDMIPVQDEEGERRDALILTKENGEVTLDFNHPYAGETLYFKGRVLAVRTASAADVERMLKEE